MFSGIVEELGEVKNISRRGNVVLLEIKAKIVSQDVKTGDSISVNGACLTLVKNNLDILSFEAIEETLKVTNLGSLRIKDKVNLERALKIGDRLCGHFVTGHIDCMGIIRRKGITAGNFSFEIAIPHKFMDNIVHKGSIAVDGISLTAADKSADTFSVYIIPHTLKNTALQFKGASDKVNIEFDVLTKRTLWKSHLHLG